jgi:ribonuclease BN (tRNA processing enzyme)
MYPIPVNHCLEATGLWVNHNKRKYVFSGDCTFTPRLIEESKEADVLIHESTFDCLVDRN